MMAKNIKGYKLEAYCAELYHDLGKLDVTSNVLYVFRRPISKKIIRKVQVDVEYLSLIFGRTIVECKYHSKGNVCVDQVEEYADRLYRLGGNHGLMFTNTDYSGNASRVADKMHIGLVDGREIMRLDKKRRNLVERIIGRERSLEQQIRAVRLEKDHMRPLVKDRYVIL